MARQLTVALAYGFAEGHYHSRKLQRALTTANYQISTNLERADIIIAHSAGCYLVPVHTRARLVLNIGYCYWPSKSLLRSLNEKLAEEYHRQGWWNWLRKCIIHDLYILNAAQTWRCIRGWRQRAAFLSATPAKIVFVRNRLDTYCEPVALLKITSQQHRYISLPGAHDHVWEEPQSYINLLQSLL